MSPLHTVTISVLVLATIIMTGSSLYLYRTTQTQRDMITGLAAEKQNTEQSLASTTNQLTLERAQASSTIHELSSRLSLTSEELDEIEDDLAREKVI